MDERRQVRELFGRETGRVGLVVCGGMSGGRWRWIRRELGEGAYPCVVGMNGVNQVVRGLDYWVGLESIDLAYLNASPVSP